MNNREVIEWLRKKAETVPMPGARKMYEAAAKAISCTHENDLISRQAAIDALMPIYKSASLRNRNVFSTARKCMAVIEEIPSAQPEIIRCKDCKHWIPCSERPPEEDHWLGGSGRQFSDNVLISILNSADEDEWVDVAQTIDGEWALELPRDCKVIAWQPLPSPYQEEGEEE